MHFYKFQADNIFSGSKLLPENMVLITDEKGTIVDILEQEEAGDSIQIMQGILSPGFINCHCHLELSHLKGLIPEKTGLVDFVCAIVSQRHFAQEVKLNGIINGENEMLTNGIVAVGDISNNLFTLGQKEKGNLKYYNFIETSGWLPDFAKIRMNNSIEYFNSFSKVGPSAIVPHSPYAVSDSLWQLLAPFFSGKTVSIHNQETIFEDSFFLEKSGDLLRMYEVMKLDTSFFQPTGKSSLQTYYSKLTAAAAIILVHNTFTKQADLDYLKTFSQFDDTFFCICPNANKYIQQAFPPLEMFIKNNCNIVFGTDSLASNWSLSILDEMKTIHRNLPTISFEEMLIWATNNGAKALQMDNHLGSFIKGKQPGIVLIEGIENDHVVSNTTVRRLL